MTASEWLDLYKEATVRCDQIQNLLHEKLKREKEHASTARVKSQIRKKIATSREDYKTLEQALETMEDAPQDFRIGGGEIGRRRGMIGNMDRQLRSFQDTMENRKTNRNEMRGLASKRGPAEETDVTLTQTSQQLQQDHNSRMQAQDGHLDTILTGVSRLKYMGQDINDELNLQNDLLDELDHTVDRVDYRLQDNTAATNALIRKEKAGCGMWIILLLFIVMIIVAIV